MAHAALYTLGAYIGVTLTNLTGNFAFALASAMILVGFVGIGVYRFAYRPLLDKPPLIALIASIGLFIASEEVFRIVFGAFGLSFADPPLATGRLRYCRAFSCPTRASRSWRSRCYL